MLTELTFEYLATEREVKALEELLAIWQQYEKPDGTFPCKDWNLQNVFQAIMTDGSRFLVSKQIKNDQFRNGLIDIEELFNGEGFWTKEEREKESGNADRTGSDQ